jgi:predicted nicotinamide N-methyase
MVSFINEHWDMFNNKRLLEIGSGTGVLAIYFKLKGFEIITSDYNDPEIEENIKFNCNLNGIDPSSLTHIRHSWGTSFPKEYLNSYDLVVANDIFLYDKEYGNLINTFEQLLHNPQIICVIHWNRRIEEFSKFFKLANERNLLMTSIAPGVYVLKTNQPK